MTRTIARGIVPALMFVAVVLATTTVGPAGAITNGELDGTAHPNVGVMVVDFGAGPRRLCSGELIAPTRFLTAGHCTSFLVNNPALLGVTFDPTYTDQESERVSALPTQHCMAHRVLPLTRSVVATEMMTSTVAQLRY